MKTYFGIVHKDDNSAYGVTFPDLPGCHAAADEMDDVLAAASEALDLWFEDQDAVEPMTMMEVAMKHADDLRDGAVLIAVPLIENDARPVRVNLSLDRGTLAAIDAAAAARKLTRSAFLAEAARKEIRGGL